MLKIVRWIMRASVFCLLAALWYVTPYLVPRHGRAAGMALLCAWACGFAASMFVLFASFVLGHGARQRGTAQPPGASRRGGQHRVDLGKITPEVFTCENCVTADEHPATLFCQTHRMYFCGDYLQIHKTNACRIVPIAERLHDIYSGKARG